MQKCSDRVANCVFWILQFQNWKTQCPLSLSLIRFLKKFWRNVCMYLSIVKHSDKTHLTNFCTMEANPFSGRNLNSFLIVWHLSYCFIINLIRNCRMVQKFICDLIKSVTHCVPNTQNDRFNLQKCRVGVKKRMLKFLPSISTSQSFLCPYVYSTLQWSVILHSSVYVLYM